MVPLYLATQSRNVSPQGLHARGVSPSPDLGGDLLRRKHLVTVAGQMGQQFELRRCQVELDIASRRLPSVKVNAQVSADQRVFAIRHQITSSQERLDAGQQHAGAEWLR